MRNFVALALGLVLVACGDHVSAPNPATDLVRASCRIYPTRVLENGSEFTCRFASEAPFIGLSCNLGSTSRSWRYASVEDFVHEIDIPNKYRRIRASTGSGGTLLVSNAGTAVTYQYDDNGRLVGRVRTGFNFTGQFTYDTTTFTAWDSRGRPTAASIDTGSSVDLVTIAYDDAAREVLWSNAERHRMDRHGNTLSETWVLRGSPFTREYEILETAEFCLP